MIYKKRDMDLIQLVWLKLNVGQTATVIIAIPFLYLGNMY